MVIGKQSLGETGLTSPCAWHTCSLTCSDSRFREQQLTRMMESLVPGWSLLSEEHGGRGKGKSEEEGFEIYCMTFRGRGMKGPSEHPSSIWPGVGPAKRDGWDQACLVSGTTGWSPSGFMVLHPSPTTGAGPAAWQHKRGCLFLVP